MSLGIVNVLDSFSVTQLRDLAFAMASSGLETPKQSASKEQLLQVLKAKSTDKSLVLFAHRIEAVTPYKHLFVYSLDASRFSLQAVKTKIEAVFPNVLHSVQETEPQLEDFVPQACIADENQSRIYLKLAHQVRMSGWASVSQTVKEWQEFRRRHPVVITFRPIDGLLTIGFPGFTFSQGVQHENRIAYSDIAASATEFLKTKLKIECEPFNAKSAIDALLEAEPEEVIDIRRNVRPKKGGRFAFDAGEEGKLTTAITDFLSREGEISVNESQIRSLLRRSGASDIVLMWKQLQILTRVALLEDGPEFLFIWRESGPSSTAVDSVLRKLTSYERIVGRSDVDALRKVLLNSSFDEVVRLATIVQEHGVSRRDALSILNFAVMKRNFEPRFRVNTDCLLVDFANTWRTNPIEFPKTVTDENGNILDLTVPSNIEVGFQRVR